MASTSSSGTSAAADASDDEPCCSSSIRQKPKQKNEIPVIRRSARLKQTEKKMEIKKVGQKKPAMKKSTKKEDSDESTDEEEKEEEEGGFKYKIWEEWLVERLMRGGDCKRRENEDTVPYMVRMLEKNGLEAEEGGNEEEEGERREPTVWEKAAVEVLVYMDKRNKIEKERLELQKRLEEVETAHLEAVKRSNEAEKRVADLNKKLLAGMDREAASSRRLMTTLRAKMEQHGLLINVYERRVAMYEQMIDQKNFEAARKGRTYLIDATENRKLKRELAGLRRSLEILASGGSTPFLDRLLEIAQEDFDPQAEMRAMRMESYQAMRQRLRRNAPQNRQPPC